MRKTVKKTEVAENEEYMEPEVQEARLLSGYAEAFIDGEVIIIPAILCSNCGKAILRKYEHCPRCKSRLMWAS